MRLKELFSLLRFKLAFPLSLSFFMGPIVNGFVPWRFWEFSHVMLCWLGLYLLITAGCLLNDFSDYESDLANPKKRNKPLVRGVVKKDTALVLGNIFEMAGAILILYEATSFGAAAFALVGVLLPLTYAEFKNFVPFDLVIDSLLVLVPIGLGFAIYNMYPIGFLVSLFFLGIMIYLHGAIFDENADKSSTVLAMRRMNEWLPNIILLVSIGGAIAFMPSILNAIALTLYNAVFYYCQSRRNWRLYTYSTLLFCGIFLLSCLLRLMGIEISVNGLLI